MKLPLEQMEWHSEYAIGNLEIDHDHIQIFGAINQYIMAVRYGCDRRLVGKILDVAGKYAASHFEREERLMNDTKYPHHETHKQAHHDFISAIKDFQSSQYDVTDISEEIAYFMHSWLKLHVLEVDAALGAYIKGLAAHDNQC